MSEWVSKHKRTKIKIPSSKTTKKKKIEIQGKPVRIKKNGQEDYICITDMAKSGQGNNKHHDIIKSYFRNRNNIEFLGLWEEMHNTSFNSGELEIMQVSTALPYQQGSG